MKQQICLAFAVSAVASLFVSSCTELTCPPGRALSEGICIAADLDSDGVQVCGIGTVWDPLEFACVPELDPTICGDGTVAILQENGVTLCAVDPSECSLGLEGICDSDLPCPQPTPGRLSLCGRILRMEDLSELEGNGLDNAACDSSSGANDGACALQIRFYDALEFAGNPNGALPLPADEIFLDACGRFRVTNLVAPALGFVGMAVDDHPLSGNDDYTLTGTPFSSPASGVRANLRPRATHRSTTMMWTESSGADFGGQDFGEVGAYVARYLDGNGQPVAGVKISANNSIFSMDDYYFSDSDPDTATSIDSSLSSTGANGTGLLVRSLLVDHGGIGSEQPGCLWQSFLAASIPGVILATERNLVDAATGQPCLP